ncbi:MAG TPA: biotin synthase, partial [Pseudomonadaceae bacterium]|nr:biotin synthase [Pseudomonadaceae bacterium]
LTTANPHENTDMALFARLGIHPELRQLDEEPQLDKEPQLDAREHQQFYDAAAAG